jgi:hypothetical protein
MDSPPFSINSPPNTAGRSLVGHAAWPGDNSLDQFFEGFEHGVTDL